MKLPESSRFKSVARVLLLVAALSLVGPAWNMIKNIFAGSGEAGAAGLAAASSAPDGAVLGDLARPQEGRSMRATSTMRVGEIRRGPNGERNTGEKLSDNRGLFNAAGSYVPKLLLLFLERALLRDTG